MIIGEVSEKTGMPASTIRYYEKVGLIDLQERVSGRRRFDQQALFALEFIRLAQAAGFTIAETKALLQAHKEKSGPAAPVWVEHASSKLVQVRKQIQDLKQVEEVLSALLSCKCSSVIECVEASEKHHDAP